MTRSLMPLVALGALLSSAGPVTSAAAGPKDRTTEALSGLCRGGKVDKCLEAGNRYRFGKDAPMDPALAAEHYDLACRGGDKYGCKALYEVALGFLAGKDHRGRPAVEDHAKAAELFELSCGGGYGPGCTSLGVARRGGDGTRKDPAGAGELFVLGCRGGSARGCRLAAEDIAGEDPGRAAGLYEKACTWKDAASCAALGRMHLDGLGAPPDEGKAFDYFLRSCSDSPRKNDTEGCFALAGMYDRGIAVGRDRAEAVRLYRQACSQTRPKKAEACYELARACKDGDGIDADANGAGQFFRQACELGSDEGCLEWRLDECRRLGQPASCEWLRKRGVKVR